MTTLTAHDLPRRSPLAMLLSVALHGAVVAGLLYASFHQVREKPNASQPISVTMVAPEVQPEPQPAVPPPVEQPQPEPPKEEPAPEPPKPEPVPIPKPEPKPKPKPVKKEVEKPKKVEPKKEPPRQANPFEENQTRAQPTKPSTAPKTNPSPVQSVATGPKAVNVSKPSYPARAFALRVEGKVRVQFDVDSDGRVDNIRILAAEPQNMFEREVKQAMRKWRYEPGRPGQNVTMTILFRINGTSVQG